jgi:hypothetical protein
VVADDEVELVGVFGARVYRVHDPGVDTGAIADE